MNIILFPHPHGCFMGVDLYQAQSLGDPSPWLQLDRSRRGHGLKLGQPDTKEKFHFFECG